MPAFATLDALRARLSGGLQDSDEPRAQAALDDASALIRAETGSDWDSDVPEIVVTVTLWVAMRAMTNPEGVSQETLAGYSYSVPNPSTDVYLTANERRLVRAAAGLSNVFTISTTRGEVPDVGPGVLTDPMTGDQYLETDSGAPIIFAGPDGY